VRECGAHSSRARKPRTLGNDSDRKIGVSEQALGALDTKRLRDLQRRRIKVLGKQTR
jgi:hypothetical protein